MFSIVKSWKDFRVFLPSFHSWLSDNVGANYKGCSADYALTLWFEEQPGYEVEGAIDALWESLTEVGEQIKWDLHEARNAAVESAKAALLTADLMQTIPAERKMLMGLPLTDEDKDALLVKYPQA